MDTSHGSILWAELATEDPAAARAWYETTCGWTFTEENMSADAPDGGEAYLVAHHGGKPVAGIMKIAPPMNDGPRWVLYIAVDDVDKFAAEAPRCFHGPMDIPGVGRIAMIEDGGGALLGVMTPSDDEGC